MTAQEAKEISESKKKSLDDILHTVKVIAETGSTEAVFDVKLIKDIEDYSSALEDLGYQVGVFSNYFRVSWK